jgi:hypothetical protein
MNTPPPRRDIFTEFGATGRDGLIVRYPDSDDGRLGSSFAAAADRLFASYKGGAPDDALLLPYLYLYRHAIELDLKYSIRYAARLRRNNGETDPDLESAAVAKRLRRQHGHRLMPLADELDLHMRALDQEDIPTSVRDTFTLIAATDPRGESFRYSGSLPDAQDYIDFPRLADTVSDAYRIASAASDILSPVEDYQHDGLAEQQALQAEYEADAAAERAEYDAGARSEEAAIQADYEADLRAEFENYG